MDTFSFLIGVATGAAAVALVSAIYTFVQARRTRKSIERGPLLGVVLPPERQDAKR